MAQVKSRLTAVEVRQAKPAETGKARILADGGGLRLVIKPNGSKYWQFRFTRDGKESSVQIGSYPNVDLATARDMANDERRRVKSGANPVLERKLDKLGKAAEAAITFKAVAEELLSIKKRNGISESYYDKIEGALKANLYPCLGDVPIGRIEPALLKNELKPIEALSVVSQRYQVVQPKEVLEFYRDLTDVSGYQLETAGVLKGGRKFWALAKTGQSTALKGNDQVHGYLLLATSCDGSLATVATAWGLLNAVTEYVDHERRARSTEYRMDSAWFGQGAVLKQRALDTALQLVA